MRAAGSSTPTAGARRWLGSTGSVCSRCSITTRSGGAQRARATEACRRGCTTSTTRGGRCSRFGCAAGWRIPGRSMCGTRGGCRSSGRWAARAGLTGGRSPRLGCASCQSAGPATGCAAGFLLVTSTPSAWRWCAWSGSARRRAGRLMIRAALRASCSTRSLTMCAALRPVPITSGCSPAASSNCSRRRTIWAGFACAAHACICVVSCPSSTSTCRARFRPPSSRG